MPHFNQPNMEKKNCAWTTSRLLEMCIVQRPTWRNEKCVYFSTNKMNSFYDCKKCKACCHVLNFPFKDQKPTIMLFGGDGTYCLHESQLRKRKAISIFEEISTPITTKHNRIWTKKGWNESKYGINVSVSYWLMIWAKFLIFESFCSISICSQPLKLNQPAYKKSWFSQFPTTESSGLSILVPTLLLLQ